MCGLLPQVRRLLVAVGTLSSGIPQVVAAETDFAQGRVRWSRSTQVATWETPHPVNASQWQQVCDPGGGCAYLQA